MSDDKLIKTINDFKKNYKGGTVPIHGKEYVLGATKIALARRNLGSDLDIVTKVIQHDDKQVMMQADIYIGSTEEGNRKHVATGTAQEFRAASRINQTSYVENCETSAVGRALSMCGLVNDSVASAEEVGIAIANQSSELDKALTELDKVSHLGSYKSWLTNNQKLLQTVKANNPIAYNFFLEKFNKIKNKLETNGVIKNG
jgi:hypothetical protein